MARPPRDGRRHETALDASVVVEAALRLVQRHGVAKLSMRGLARQLGVSVMALYHYVRSKEELLDKLREAVLSRVPTPPVNASSWESQLRAYALAGATLLAEYPGLLRFSAIAQPTPSEKRLTRHGIAILLAAGCDPRTAALAIKTYHTHIFGIVIAQAVEPAGPRARGPRKLKQDEVALVARQIGQLSFRESAEFGIDTVLAGLRTQIAEARERQQSDARKARRG